MENAFEDSGSVDLGLIKTIVDRLPAMVALYSLKSGRYVYVNDFIKDLLGYEPADFLNGGVVFAMSLIHPEDALAVMGNNQVAVEATNEGKIAPGRVVMFEYRMKHKDGSWVRLRTDGRVFDTETEGNVNYVLNVSMAVDAPEAA